MVKYEMGSGFYGEIEPDNTGRYACIKLMRRCGSGVVIINNKDRVKIDDIKQALLGMLTIYKSQAATKADAERRIREVLGMEDES